jgi:hypothetical protein
MASIIDDTRSSLKPIYEAKPDMRFATTFLSNKYRDYAVKGESIMDKTTGEIFTKRPEDGRVVSFFQNKKYMMDLALNLRILLNNNASFRYPSEDKLEAQYLSVDYDVMSINDEKDINIMDNDIIIPNDEEATYHNLYFQISKESNGFFCRLTSRDADKTVLEWATTQYNALFSSYDGSDTDFLAEKEKLESIEKWADSNATINYTVILSKNGKQQNLTFTDYIRVNEDSCLTFPVTLSPEVLLDTDTVTVRINSFTFDKLHTLYHYRASLPTKIIEGFDKFLYPDERAYIRYINICSFVDRSEDVILHENEFIVAMMDAPYIYRLMMKMNMIVDDSTFLLSPTRPGSDVWKTNGIWGEQIRDVFKGDYEIDLDSETDLKQLENYLAANDDTDYVSLDLDNSSTKGIYGKQV